MQRLQRGDTVVVISGKDKGKQGRVTRVLLDDDKVVVEGSTWSSATPSRTRATSRAASSRKRRRSHASKVMPVDPETGKPTRVKVQGRRRRQRRRASPRAAPRSRRGSGDMAKKTKEDGKKKRRRRQRRRTRRRRPRPSKRARASRTSSYRETKRSAALTKQFNYKNPMQVPRLQKIVVNMGLGAAVGNPKIIDSAVDELARHHRAEAGGDARQEVDRDASSCARACRSA